MAHLDQFARQVAAGAGGFGLDDEFPRAGRLGFGQAQLAGAQALFQLRQRFFAGAQLAAQGEFALHAGQALLQLGQVVLTGLGGAGQLVSLRLGRPRCGLLRFG